MKKYIIGLGCSWTAGEGGYPDHIWHQYNGSPQRYFRKHPEDEYSVKKYELENSWVNVLCRDYFSDHTPMNLGVKGIGNYGAVHQLHFCNRIDWTNSTGIIIYQMSGFERLDLFQHEPYLPNRSPLNDDSYSNNEFIDYKWRTAWPNESDSGSESMYWNVYARSLWSEQFVSSWQMMALLDVQTFAKAHGFKLIVTNSFNYRNEGIIDYLRNNTGQLADTFNWDEYYFHNTVDYTAMMQLLVRYDKKFPEDQWWHEYYTYYSKLPWPSEYLTNCDGAHPTIKGYKVIAEELAKYIINRKYI